MKENIAKIKCWTSVMLDVVALTFLVTFSLISVFVPIVH